jgi:copper chaperone CopZ
VKELLLRTIHGIPIIGNPHIDDAESCAIYEGFFIFPEQYHNPISSTTFSPTRKVVFGAEMDNADTITNGDEIKVLQATPEASSTVQLAIGGMTCVACVRTITDAVLELEGVVDISVNQLGKSASAVVTRTSLVDSMVTLIEDIGYECQVVSITPISLARTSGHVDDSRVIALEIKGVLSM